MNKQDIDKKTLKPIYVDKNTAEGYDKKTVNSGNPQKLYKINDNSKLTMIK